MGRPLKIKISDTRDAGFNNPNGNGTPSGELSYGQVGGNFTLSSGAFPVTTTRIKIGTVAEANGYIIRQKGSTKYLVADSTGVTAGSFIVDNQYIITAIGNTNWQAIGANPGAGVGSTFSATGVGAGTGTADTIGVCVLANLADASLTANTMTITYADVGSTLVRVRKMSNKFAVPFGSVTTQPHVLVNYFNISDDTVAIGGSGDSSSPNTIDLVQIENPQFG